MVFRKLHFDTLFQMQKCVEMQILSSGESGKVIPTHSYKKKVCHFTHFNGSGRPPTFQKPNHSLGKTMIS